MKHRTRKPSPSDDRTETVGPASWDALWASSVLVEPIVEIRREDGWRTPAELAESRGCSTRIMQDRLMRGTRAGRFERIKARSENGPQLAVYYRPMVAR